MADDRPPPDRGNDINLKAILGVAAGILLVWFIIANSQPVEVTWWVLNTSTSLFVVILVSALLGAGVTYLLMRLRRRPAREHDVQDGDPG